MITVRERDQYFSPLAIFFLLSPAIAIFAPKFVAITFPVAVLTEAVIFRKLVFQRGGRLDTVHVICVGFILYCATTLSYTPDVPNAAVKLLTITSYIVLAMVAGRLVRDYSVPNLEALSTSIFFGAWLGIGAYVLGLLAAAVLSSAFDFEFLLTNGPRALAFIVTWVAISSIESGSRWKMLIILAMLFVAFLSDGIAGKVISASVAASIWLMHVVKLTARRSVVLPTIIGVIILFAPLVIRNADYNILMERSRDLPTSVQSRVQIWEQAARRISEKPYFGWGFDSARFLPNRDEISWIYPEEPMPIAHLHPHNTVLQVWFELGVIGAVGYMLIICSIFGVIRRVSDIRVGFGLQVVVLATFLLNLALWGAWQGWFIALQVSVFVGGAVVYTLAQKRTYLREPAS